MDGCHHLQRQLWKSFHSQSTFSLPVHDRALSDHDYFGPCLLFFPNPATSLQFDGQLGQTPASAAAYKKLKNQDPTALMPQLPRY
ncbi:hypothetical protein MUK42_21819 [Musa troglodytarum]|uniref:Uncharacterized protein n=1 Tax=Musa troglodytarum TaxID=320322 RepID=A0A9E7GCW3_9LILI|nr:hypothetical protein MUK42_21819 [Musa troglodytarum]